MMSALTVVRTVEIPLDFCEASFQGAVGSDESIAEARTTGDGGRLAAGLAHRGWLALRHGDLRAAEVARDWSELARSPTSRNASTTQ